MKVSQKPVQINQKTGAVLFLIYLLTSSSYADQPPSIGNFSLDSSQEPGLFFSFGQNIIDKNQLILSINPNYLYSPGQPVVDETPSLLYGISDTSSVLLTLPYSSNYNNGSQKLSGTGDFILDLEYAYYSNNTTQYSDQATIVFSPTFPTSNLDEISTSTTKVRKHNTRVSRKNAPTNNDTASYFFGTTYSRTLVDWYGFIAPGFLVFNKKEGLQQGSQYFYNVGLGRNIKSVEKEYIFFGLVELNGQYTDKTRLNSRAQPNSGGNIIYATPSLWYSTPKFIIQLGISLPINQYWYGDQPNTSYYASTIISYTIN